MSYQLTLHMDRSSTRLRSSPGQTVTKLASAFFPKFDAKRVIKRMQEDPSWAARYYRLRFWERVHETLAEAKQHVPSVLSDLMDTGCECTQSVEGVPDATLACWYVLGCVVSLLCEQLEGKTLARVPPGGCHLSGLSPVDPASELRRRLDEIPASFGVDTKEHLWLEAMAKDIALPWQPVACAISRYIEREWEATGEEKREAGIRLHEKLHAAFSDERRGKVQLGSGTSPGERLVQEYARTYRQVLGVDAIIASELPVTTSEQPSGHCKILGRVDVVFLSRDQPDPGVLHVQLGDYKYSTPETMKAYGDPGFGPCQGLLGSTHTKATIALWLYAHILENFYPKGVSLGGTHYQRLVVDRLCFIYLLPAADEVSSGSYVVEEVARDPVRLTQILSAS